MNDSLVGSMLSFAGISGTDVPTGGVVPRLVTPQNQDLLDQEFRDFGAVQNPDTWLRFNQMLNRPSSFTAMLELWEQMSAWDLLAAALVQVVDEATQFDSTSPGPLWYECDDPDIEEQLNSMLDDINLEEVLPSQFWHVAGLGNNFEKIEYARGAGVSGLTFVHPTRVRRYWLKRTRQCIGYYWQDGKPNKDDVYRQGDTMVQRQTLGGNSNETTQLWYPWDFLHMRRMYRMRESEHGEPIFEEAEGIYKKLKMALEQMVVHRAQVQPDRYVVNIDTAEQPPADQMRTVQRWKQNLRSKLSFGTNEAQVDDFKSFYNALALDSILYMARPKGYTHAIEKLPGTMNVPDVYDVEMLTNLFFSIIGMPKEWLGGTQGEGGPTSGRALLAQDIRFLRKIKALRRPVIDRYTWLGYFHLVLLGKDIRNITLEARMSDIGSLEDQLKMETLKLQSEVLNSLGDAMDKFKLPREAFVEVIFSKYMHLDDEVVNAFLTALPPDSEMAEESRKTPEKRSSRTSQLLRELQSHVGNNPRAGMLMQSLRETLNGKTAKHRNRVTETKITQMPAVQTGDLVISSFDKDPTVKPNGGAEPRTGYRRFNWGGG